MTSWIYLHDFTYISSAILCLHTVDVNLHGDPISDIMLPIYIGNKIKTGIFVWKIDAYTRFNMMMADSTKGALSLVLGSTSPFRKELLGRLGIEFLTSAPDTDESPLANETPQDLVARLSQAKAQAVAVNHPQALIIGSDQVAVLDGNILGKPGTHENAMTQLRQASGKSVTFYTGLCLLNSATGEKEIDVIPFRVVFRTLSEQQIEHYLLQETPYNCAGSFKSEGMGIALFERMEGDDPTALIGLPLIRLTTMLADQGMPVL